MFASTSYYQIACSSCTRVMIWFRFFTVGEINTKYYPYFPTWLLFNMLLTIVWGSILVFSSSKKLHPVLSRRETLEDRGRDRSVEESHGVADELPLSPGWSDSSASPNRPSSAVPEEEHLLHSRSRSSSTSSNGPPHSIIPSSKSSRSTPSPTRFPSRFALRLTRTVRKIGVFPYNDPKRIAILVMHSLAFVIVLMFVVFTEMQAVKNNILLGENETWGFGQVRCILPPKDKY
jgi:hypothetical protein